MNTSQTVIDMLRSRGFYVETRACYGDGAFLVASELQEVENYIQVLKDVVVVAPAADAWVVSRVGGPMFVEPGHATLALAGEAAAKLVIQLREQRRSEDEREN